MFYYALSVKSPPHLHGKAYGKAAKGPGKGRHFSYRLYYRNLLSENRVL
jgi:hypothetical protein